MEKAERRALASTPFAGIGVLWKPPLSRDAIKHDGDSSGTVFTAILAR